MNKTEINKSPEAAPKLGLATGSAGSVFELIELQQCEDNYYPLGIFLTLTDAIAAVETVMPAMRWDAARQCLLTWAPPRYPWPSV